MARIKREVAVIDFETDPFEHDRTPEPFLAGFFDGTSFVSFWGKDCVAQLVAFLHSLKRPLIVYAHNGGKFDFVFMLSELSNPIRIVRGRILTAMLGVHELRDSYALLPFPLAAYKKTKIDYRIFEADKREANRAEITAYMRDDCVDLHTLVTRFRADYGDKLTMGAVALRELRALHPFPDMGPHHDQRFRPYFFGGRVECFEQGVIDDDLAVYDVNSMYPAAMALGTHPCGGAYSQFHSLRDLMRYAVGRYPYFVTWRGLSLGAMPQRDHAGRLAFPHGEGEWMCTHHEFEEALDLGLIHPERVIVAHVCETAVTFPAFVERFMTLKTEAKRAGDTIAYLGAKYIANGAYGKTATNPEHYKDYFIRKTGDAPPEDDDSAGPVPFNRRWHPLHEFPGGEIYGRASTRPRYVDVALGASITGWSRSRLLRAIAGAVRPLYCDTDSLICRALPGEAIDPYALGAWKHEASGTRVAIAGKKLYAVWNGDQVVKVATKGFDIRTHDGESDKKKLAKIVLLLTRGGKYAHHNEAPNFKLDGSARFVTRTISATNHIGA